MTSIHHKLKLQVKKLSDTALIPIKHMIDDAGIDLFSDENVDIPPRGQKIIKTGIAFAIPTGYCGIIKDRSSIATKKKLNVMAGVIDAQYRGEIGIVLQNHSDEVQTVKRFDKISQMLIVPVPLIQIEQVEELSSTERGTGGFGSSGK